MKGEETSFFHQAQPCGNQSLKIFASPTLESVWCGKVLLVKCPLNASFSQQQCWHSVDFFNTEWLRVSNGFKKHPLLRRFIQCCNDVESNPGPLNGKILCVNSTGKLRWGDWTTRNNTNEILRMLWPKKLRANHWIDHKIFSSEKYNFNKNIV